MPNENDPRPLVAESSTSETSSVEVVLNSIRDGDIEVPDYQRDSDQWDDETKSLLIESVINNLTVPAFFLEVKSSPLGEKNEVVDGQQRLTTLDQFFRSGYKLVSAEDAPYLSPHSVHYAGKTFAELPAVYQNAFKKYRLTLIKLRELGGTRMEVFRRINQGGTPLSGQDIRLAYFSDDSPSVVFIRLAGIFDQSRIAAKRVIEGASSKHNLPWPWNSQSAIEAWKGWWEDKHIALGQTASEMFLFSLACAQRDKLATLLANQNALRALNIKFNNNLQEALDVFVAQLQFQDKNPSLPPVFMDIGEMRDKFFPHFQTWIDDILNKSTIPVSKHRMMAMIIGAAYRQKLTPSVLTPPHIAQLNDLLRQPLALAQRIGIDLPASKGRWEGNRGHAAQFAAVEQILLKIVQ